MTDINTDDLIRDLLDDCRTTNQPVLKVSVKALRLLCARARRVCGFCEGTGRHPQPLRVTDGNELCPYCVMAADRRLRETRASVDSYRRVIDQAIEELTIPELGGIASWVERIRRLKLLAEVAGEAKKS